MKIIVITFWLFFSLVGVIAQTLTPTKQGNIWIMSDSAGLDFNVMPPQVITTDAPVFNYNFTRWYHASTCDTTGSLLYYDRSLSTNSLNTGYPVGVYDRNHTPFPEDSALETIDRAHSMFLPFTGTTRTAYVYMYPNFNVPQTNLSTIQIRYCMIEDTARGGMGGFKGGFAGLNLPIATYDSIAYTLGAVRHANGRDWWVVGHEFLSNRFIIALATPDTVALVRIQSIGEVYGKYDTQFGGSGSGGEMVFSRDGSRLITNSNENLIQSFAFDRCTGVLSDYKLIQGPVSDTVSSFEHPIYIALSPYGKLLYVQTGIQQNTINVIFQYDLISSDIMGTRTELFRYPNSVGAGSGCLQLGLDNRIYISHFFMYPPWIPQNPLCPLDSMYISTIEHPDVVGLGCGLSLNSVYMGGKKVRKGNLPRMPYYDLGPVDNSTCDTLGLDQTPLNSQAQALSKATFQVYPNPATTEVSLKWETPAEFTNWAVLDIWGRTILQGAITEPSATNLSLANLPAGLYFIELTTPYGNKQRVKVVKE
jgi:hypothetical protein